MIHVNVSRRSAIASNDELLTSGSVGIPCDFAFDDAWQGLTKTAIFIAGGEQRDVILEDDTCTVPWEVLQEAGAELYVGVYGSDGDSVVIPTVYVFAGMILRGADPSGDESTEPTLPVWAQLQEAMGDLSELQTEEKSTLVAAINEAAQSGGSGGGEIWLPSVDASGNISWSKSSTDTPPLARNITGPAGEIGPQGPAGADGADGTNGASAYQQAVAAGYTGTLAEFTAALSGIGGKIDKSAQAEKTSGMTQAVGIDASGKLWTAPGGGGGGASAASDVSIADAGGYFDSDNVEGALQEVGAELSGINTLVGSGVIS